MVRMKRWTWLWLVIVSGLWMASPATAQDTPPNTITNPVIPVIYDYPMPAQASLCGEPVPLDDPYAYEMLDRELTIVAWDRPQVFMWLKRIGRYFPYIERRLAEEGLPSDLKYLAITESSLIPYVRSSAGAVGTWQFMEFTGTRYGLRKDQNFDDRLSFERSTEAAIAYLKRLYNLFGAWNLALAAYNCGEACVGKEIDEQGVRDYYKLDLPFETERFVFRTAAIKVILENLERYGYALPPDRGYGPEEAESVQVNLASPVHFTAAAQAVGTYYKVLRELNPEIRSRYLPPGQYSIRVPIGTAADMSAFLRRATTPASTTAASNAGSGDTYLVKRGDTLTKIASRTGVSVDVLRQLNGIKGGHIEIGQRLRLRP